MAVHVVEVLELGVHMVDNAKVVAVETISNACINLLGEFSEIVAEKPLCNVSRKVLSRFHYLFTTCWRLLALLLTVICRTHLNAVFRKNLVFFSF